MDDIWAQLQKLEEQEELEVYAPELEPGQEEDMDYPDADEAEFSEFVSQDPEEFGFSYKQLEHVGFGDIGLGGIIAGDKFSKIAQLRTIPKEVLFMNKLKSDLHKYFSFENVNHFATIIKDKIPRYWLKNSEALAAAAYVVDTLRKRPLTVENLANYATETGLRKEDLLRYYKLF